MDLQPPSEMDPDWGASSTEEETPQGSTAALGGFANHLTGLLRAALSNRAWSTVTSKSPASQKANSDSDSHRRDAVDRGGGDSRGLREGRSREDQGAPAVHHGAEGGEVEGTATAASPSGQGGFVHRGPE